MNGLSNRTAARLMLASFAASAPPARSRMRRRDRALATRMGLMVVIALAYFVARSLP